MKYTTIIIIALLIIMITIEGYIAYQVIKNNATCVLNPVGYLKKSAPKDYVCGCFPEDLISRNVIVDFNKS